MVADIDNEASEIVLLIHWIGGVQTELRLPKRRRGQRNSTSADIIAAIRRLVLIANDLRQRDALAHATGKLVWIAVAVRSQSDAL